MNDSKKLSIIYILKILRDYSDENHLLTQSDIVKKLNILYGLYYERKSVSSNIESLIDLGFDIIKTNKGCYLGEREFEESEISFIVDSLFSNKAISAKQAIDLSKKLYNCLSIYKRKKYNYLYKAEEISRIDNVQVFYNIEVINEAIENCKQISFEYNTYNRSGKLQPKNKTYIINPYFMVNSLGKYYLVGNYDYFNDISNYRIEKITNIKIVDNPIKRITELPEFKNGCDISKYINQNIYLFAGKTITAKLKLINENAVSQVYDWFGKDARVYEKDKTLFAEVKANEESLIYWCIQFCNLVELISPIDVREYIIQQIEQSLKMYKGD